MNEIFFFISPARAKEGYDESRTTPLVGIWWNLLVVMYWFRKSRVTGSHLQSLQAVLDGTAHACAIDSHVLDMLQQEQPELKTQIRIVEQLGPSTIPPLVIASRLDRHVKQQIRAALLSMHEVPSAAQELQKGRIERFVAVQDEIYNDIRTMFAQVQQL